MKIKFLSPKNKILESDMIIRRKGFRRSAHSCTRFNRGMVIGALNASNDEVERVIKILAGKGLMKSDIDNDVFPCSTSNNNDDNTLRGLVMDLLKV